MKNIAVILLGSGGINIGECYRENYSRKVPLLLFESHKTLYQAERGAIIVGQVPTETSAADVLLKAHGIGDAAAITEDYYDNVPDYIEGPHGKILFFTTAEEQFGNNSPEKTLARAEFYEQEIIEAMSAYDHVILVACMGGSVSIGVAPFIARLAKRHRISMEAIVTMPAMFEGKKRRHQAEKGLAGLQKFSKVNVLAAEHKEESIIDYFKLKDLTVARAIEQVIINYNNI